MNNNLINALLKPGFYDHPVEHCELIETHISWVILAGDYAYKIKKPVDFGFLDFSTLEKRHFYCDEELRLNRRLAADIYLDVVAISGSDAHPRLSADGPVIEYMVKMRRFEQEQQLDRMLANNKLHERHVDALASMVARFHDQIERSDATSRFGSAEQVYAPVEENFLQIRQRVEETRYVAQLDTLEAWCKQAHATLRPFMEQRKQAGFVRECHGDMHLRNLAWINDQPVAFDCIEFNENLRWVDVISEIAFFVMDLHEKQQAPLAQRFLNAYLQASGDYEGLRLLHYYLVYRALVRAKVDAIRLAQGNTSDTERAEAESDFGRYLELATGYIQPQRPLLLLTHGMSASGKSTLSQKLLEQLGAIRIRSDVERKRLFNIEADADNAAPVDSGIYTMDATQRTYDRLAELAGHVLDAGYPVIVDATFKDPSQRAQFKQLADVKQVGFVILSFTAPADVLRQRIIERGKGVSDANLAVLEHQLAHWQPLADTENSDVIEIDTRDPLDIQSLLKCINEHANKDVKE